MDNAGLMLQPHEPPGFTAMSQVFLYDTTLRDGTQREDISLSVDDKLTIARRLAEFGIHYIEGGWPGSNPKDAEFFARAGRMNLGATKLAAFGSTRHKHTPCEDDANLKALLAADTPAVTLVGKSWDYHVSHVLDTTPEENLAMIRDSVAWMKAQGREVFFDAEHFYDGFLANPEFALATLQVAAEAGADWLILCETNGGKLPWQVEEITRDVASRFSTRLGVHCHNDTGCGVANSIAAVRGGCALVQGTINGYGERVGNADLVSIIPNLQLKMGYEAVRPEQLRELTGLSRFVAEVANLKHDDHHPYVGHSAFAHKGGIHVAAILKASDTYQHIEPELVGNERRSVISELSGRGNILFMAQNLGIDVNREDAQKVLGQIKHMEHEGFTFEAAEASVELLFHRLQEGYQRPFELVDYFVITERRHGRGLLSEATVKVKVDGEVKFTAAEGNGPVNALATALQHALVGAYPVLRTVRLSDYKVRILNSATGTAASTRVLIDFQSGSEAWTTVGASTNIIEASWRALADSMEYALLRLGEEGQDGA
ncbi:MAG: 2-isopropylmalate synthase [bacterium]|nr:MAG: 2-isopropylmalate synthase [bacterium]KAF0148111.1 MAG: 2-isopropylmalate synthase [bacterium]KAF0167623.1 MAG: 2-isopropylmalate synthase [bacterium]TXT19466.1 MAG: 2-isopropylmalate synthase [bacterium]